jgi:hypothetical protein
LLSKYTMSALSGSQHVLYYGGRVNSVAGNTLVNSLRNFRIIPPYGGCSKQVWYTSIAIMIRTVRLIKHSSY